MSERRQDLMDASVPQQSQSAANPLMAAVKKLTGKE